MTSLAPFVPLARQALRNPREAAQNLLSLGVPASVIGLLLALAIVVSALLSGLTDMIRPIPDTVDAERVIVLPPIAFAAILAFILVGFGWGIFRVGRAMGGTGALAESLLLVAFWQIILIGAQVVELALLTIAPMLAAFFVLGVVVMALWIEINFIDALHGFGSLLKSFFVFLFVCLGIGLALGFLMTLTGVTVESTA